MKEETKALLLKKIKEIVLKFPQVEAEMLELWQIIIDDDGDGGDKGKGGVGLGRTPQQDDEKEQELQRKIKESDNTVAVSIRYFNPHKWSKEEVKKDDKKQQILDEILRQRLMILKQLYVNTRFKNVPGGFIECEFLKAENPDWKEKLKNFIKSDKEFCEQKTKELGLKDAFTEDLNNRLNKDKGGPKR
ncbi:MAG: hypothetical protein ACYCSQ_07505 [bacterium]